MKKRDLEDVSQELANNNTEIGDAAKIQQAADKLKATASRARFRDPRKVEPVASRKVNPL